MQSAAADKAARPHARFRASPAQFVLVISHSRNGNVMQCKEIYHTISQVYAKVNRNVTSFLTLGRICQDFRYNFVRIFSNPYNTVIPYIRPYATKKSVSFYTQKSLVQNE